jgi:endonuclease/exonuclease/phosphatase (EEP) superfamily protein YafD
MSFSWDDSRLARTSDLVLGVLCLAAIATFAGELFWLLDLASHFQVYYLAVALALLLGNVIFKRQRSALVSLVLVGIGAFHLYPYFLPVGEPETEGKSYKVMLLNLHLHNEKTAAVKEAIAAADPDILVLQEVTPRWRQELNSLPANFRHSFDLPEKGAFGIWVLSKFKSTDLDVQRREGVAFLHLKYQVGKRELEVVALHPVPPIGGAASRVRNTILADAAVYAAGEGSRIAIGDFNCSPWSTHFKRFLKQSGLRDSARGRGRGVKGTWHPQRLLGIPIDHVLVSPDIAVVDRTVGDDVGSDHRPVTVTFQFTSK